jgi:two-component system response regulator HupR/HoxA
MEPRPEPRPAKWQTRHPRVPLCIPIFLRPGLDECWLVNLSSTGFGLVARVATGAEPPREGAILQLEMNLPDGHEPIRGTCSIEWLTTSPDRTRLTLGMSFVEMSATDRALLAQYLAMYRPRIGVLDASPEQEALCRKMEREAILHFIRTESELNDLLVRGDVCALLIYGANESAAVSLVEKVANRTPLARELVPGLNPAPGLIFCAEASERTLLRLHNEGKVLLSFDSPPSYELLFRAVQRASHDHAIRSELSRASHEMERAQIRTRAPEKTRDGPRGPLAGITVSSEVMRDVLDMVQLVARDRIPVLLIGETGTGKELLARALHGLSDRANAPFIAQDCGALTETLLESELFGHVRGAFTGAVTDHPGLFRLADGGTIFLDEVENTSPGFQIKLLRVLETGEVRPVGGAVTRKVDVRVVAASNRDLRAEAEEGRFRADLFYRLSPFPIEIPSLREREGDVMVLAKQFLEKLGRDRGRSFPGFTPEAEQLLAEYRWPGNVRELRNTIERAVLLATPGEPVGARCLPRHLVALRRGAESVNGEASSLKERVLQYERELIRTALTAHKGVLSRAAADLQVNAVTLGRRAKQLGVWPLEPERN